jgi:hypothetical protein
MKISRCKYEEDKIRPFGVRELEAVQTQLEDNVILRHVVDRDVVVY